MSYNSNKTNHQEEFVDSLLQNRVVLSIGVKGSGKSYLMLNFLRHALKNMLFQRYVLVLPAFRIEANDSYNFIDAKRKDIFIFESYHEIISSSLMDEQMDDKTKLKTLFIIDDASGQSVWHLDTSLQKLITIIRHLDITLWMLVHAATGILSPFLRMNSDVLLLSKMVNAKLLECIWEEYLSLTQEYQTREGHKLFMKHFIEMHMKKFQVLYLDLRKNIISFDAGNFSFQGKAKGKAMVEPDDIDKSSKYKSKPKPYPNHQIHL